MRAILQRLAMLFFGKRHAEPLPVAQHAEAIEESAKRRHELVGTLHELDVRLHFLAMEAQADAGVYGPRQEHPDPHG